METHDFMLCSILSVLLVLHELRRIVERLHSQRQDREQRDTNATLLRVVGLHS